MGVMGGEGAVMGWVGRGTERSKKGTKRGEWRSNSTEWEGTIVGREQDK